MTLSSPARTAAFAAILWALAGAASAKPPKLTLVVTVDSMSTDLVQRMRGRLKGGGLSQLLNQGAYYGNGRVEYADSRTAPGHATLVTGCNPWRHGIIGNDLFNRSTSKLEAVFGDPDHPVLEAPPGASDASPVNLLAETLPDRIRLVTQERGKAISISAKPRSAIAMGGRLGKAFWFSDAVGKWVTGTWYTKEFPAWLKTFNDRALPDSYFGKEWALTEKPEAYTGEDDRSFESSPYGMGRVFPHPLTGGLPRPGREFYAALNWSPLMSEVVTQAARAAIDGEQLGKDEVGDLLLVSFSSLDYAQHFYGPYSWEAQDALLRVDKSLGDLIAYAEKAAGGKGNLLVAVTSDHGMAALPEEWAAAGMPGRRVNPVAVQQAMASELSSVFGGDINVRIEALDIYLSGKTYSHPKTDALAVRRAAAAWMQKQTGVAIAVARDDLERPAELQGYKKALRLGFHPDRSGDVVFIPLAFTVFDAEPRGTDHGTPYSYDTQIPVFFSGRGVRTGAFAQEFSLADVAPTLAALMDIGAPAQSEGRVHGEVIGGK